jgi:ribosomal protein L12E/L44/L45/RPP1/RPP2
MQPYMLMPPMFGLGLKLKESDIEEALKVADITYETEDVKYLMGEINEKDLADIYWHHPDVNYKVARFPDFLKQVELEANERETNVKEFLNEKVRSLMEQKSASIKL